jgi:hypothetical protein
VNLSTAYQWAPNRACHAAPIVRIDWVGFPDASAFRNADDLRCVVRLQLPNVIVLRPGAIRHARHVPLGVSKNIEAPALPEGD